MKRRAFIVVTPNCPGQKPLPGADDDAREWVSFLSSPEGGAWNVDDEITVMKNPSKYSFETQRLLDDDSELDYALLAFSGHGECVDTKVGREACLFFSSTEYVTEAGFTLSAKRELLILDSCRELRDERTLLVLNAKEADLNEQLIKAANRSERLKQSRTHFEAAIAKNPLGRSFVYSCGVNETAADRPSFSVVLIEQSTDKVTNDFLYGVKSIQDVFPLAESVVTKFKQPQHPIYEAGRRMTHLPFAVSV